MATSKNQQTLILVAVLGAGGFIVYKLFGHTRGVSAASSGAAMPAGYMPGYFPQQYPQQDNSLLGAILRALAGLGKSSGSSSGAGSNKNQAKPDSAISRFVNGPESIAQALARGDYTGDNQNVLAGIFNMQQGAGDFAGDSRDQVASSFGEYQLGSNVSDYSIPYEDAYAQMDLTASEVPIGDVGAGYADTQYGNYIDNSSIGDGFSSDMGGTDWSNYDWSGGGGGWDVGGDNSAELS